MPQLLHCLAVSQLFLLPIVFKAKGINKDLFGNEQAIFSTPEVSKEMLVTALKWLFCEEINLKEVLAIRIPELQKTAILATAIVNETING